MKINIRFYNPYTSVLLSQFQALASTLNKICKIPSWGVEETLDRAESQFVEEAQMLLSCWALFLRPKFVTPIVTWEILRNENHKFLFSIQTTILCLRNGLDFFLWLLDFSLSLVFNFSPFLPFLELGTGIGLITDVLYGNPPYNIM